MDQIWQYMDQFQQIWTVLSETLSTGSLDWTYGLLDPVNCYYFLRRTGPKNWSIPIGPCSSHFVPHMSQKDLQMYDKAAGVKENQTKIVIKFNKKRSS